MIISELYVVYVCPGVAEDRLRIETDGVMTDSLSVQHLLSCDTEEQMGCKGGRLDRAWWFMRATG